MLKLENKGKKETAKYRKMANKVDRLLKTITTAQIEAQTKREQVAKKIKNLKNKKEQAAQKKGK